MKKKQIWAAGMSPGFIDSHLHLESTLVTPAELVTVASRHGTTTFIVDPHESANVSGLKGIDYILNQISKTWMHTYCTGYGTLSFKKKNSRTG